MWHYGVRQWKSHRSTHVAVVERDAIFSGWSGAE